MRQGINKSVSVYTYLVCGWLCWTPCIYAAIDIELRPILQSAEINDIINVRLFVVSDSGSPQSIAAMDIVLVWDASRLKLTGYTDPCDESPCPDNTYAWLQSWFPEDDSLDGLNDDCGDGVFCNSILCKTGCPEGATCDQFSGFCKTTKLPFNDGDAKYVAWSNIGGGENSAQATPEGLWVTSFQFQVISTGTAEVRVVDTLGTFSTTRIADGDEPGILVTGLIGLPAEIVIGGCVPPVVEAVGSRTLRSLQDLLMIWWRCAFRVLPLTFPLIAFHCLFNRTARWVKKR